ncbi:hypothetical protein QJS10_CPA02g00139 [Acorus calamus]|uniref:Uncharacterized protein n=1 Tax=Acorus calamus TaxID=4465 RepID=A0AAV9FB21_ACOCL|nr:hypothetical protein QJS10_CPA02g00139 [Acorus calamus]
MDKLTERHRPICAIEDSPSAGDPDPSIHSRGPPVWDPRLPHPHHHHRRRSNRYNRNPIVVVMGSTGTGKSRLSVNVASRFQSEVINYDKIPLRERRGVPPPHLTPRSRSWSQASANRPGSPSSTARTASS